MPQQSLCLIAGVGPGMGLALARRFAKGGSALALLARNPEQLAALCVTIQAEGGTAYAYPVDLTDAAALHVVLTRIASWH
jgi:NADP-dependent 3-hydroxy acid dehydrogenase YdfG